MFYRICLVLNCQKLLDGISSALTRQWRSCINVTLCLNFRNLPRRDRLWTYCAMYRPVSGSTCLRRIGATKTLIAKIVISSLHLPMYVVPGLHARPMRLFHAASIAAEGSPTYGGSVTGRYTACVSLYLSSAWNWCVCKVAGISNLAVSGEKHVVCVRLGLVHLNTRWFYQIHFASKIHLRYTSLRFGMNWHS